MNDRLLIGLLKVLPRNLYSRAVGGAAHLPLPRAARAKVYRAFAKRYGVSLDEVEHPLEDYRSLGEFFVRRLARGARPVDGRDRILVSPSDGVYTNGGPIEGGALLQAKGIRYPLAALLQDQDAAERFGHGAYHTVYLSPRDYHRVHFPASGDVVAARYVPGTLFPVNRAGVERVPGLFTINERVVTYLDTELHGRVAVVLVGALAVGRITVSYDDLESNRGRGGEARVYEPPVPVVKGDELGVFHLGSTVVMICERADHRALVPTGSPVKMGQAFLELPSPDPPEELDRGADAGTM